MPNLASQIRRAFSRIEVKTDSSPPGELEITRSTSEVAANCSRASLSSRSACARRRSRSLAESCAIACPTPRGLSRKDAILCKAPEGLNGQTAVVYRAGYPQLGDRRAGKSHLVFRIIQR